MDSKTCAACGVDKSVFAFGRESRTQSGLQASCRQCEKARKKALYEVNRDRYNAANRVWAETHPERARSIKADYYSRNKEDVKEKAVAWRKNHPEYVRAASSRRRSRIKLLEMSRKKSLAYRLSIKELPCHYCGEVKSVMEDDHYFPLSRGGTDHWFNLVRACWDCNHDKGSKLASKWRGND